MNKDKFGCRENFQRISYTKSFKRRALLELVKGKLPQDILKSATKDILSFNTSDKKYFSKLLHKWKKELYCDNRYVFFNSIDPNDLDLEYELINMHKVDEIDEINNSFENFRESENSVQY